MKNFSFLLLILFAGCVKQIERKKDDKAIKAFMSFYQHYVIKQNKIVVLDTIGKMVQYSDLWNTLEIDSLKKKDFEQPSLMKWDARFFNDATILTYAEDLKISRDFELYKKFFNETGGYYGFSQPLFSRDKQYVLISVFFVCRQQCGYSNIEMYKKTAASWKLVKIYSHTVF